jgi:hypothetical protein
MNLVSHNIIIYKSFNFSDYSQKSTLPEQLAMFWSEYWNSGNTLAVGISIIPKMVPSSRIFFLSWTIKSLSHLSVFLTLIDIFQQSLPLSLTVLTMSVPFFKARSSENESRVLQTAFLDPSSRSFHLRFLCTPY